MAGVGRRPEGNNRRVSSPALPPRPASVMRAHALVALRNHNYRLFFAGQVVSTTGAWIQSIALSWLALQVTHDPLRVGVVVAAQLLPTALSPTIGGIVAERRPRRQVLMLTQAAQAVPSLLLFGLASTANATFPALVLLALATGAVSIFDIPARQAFVTEMVGREDLMNAIALNSSVLNAAVVAGPALGGILIAVAGPAPCFLANAMTSVAALAALAAMRRMPRLVPRTDRAGALLRLREGADHVRRDPDLLLLLLVSTLLSLFAMNRLTLIPVFAGSVLHTGPAGFGLLMAALGLGSLVGAVTLTLARPDALTSSLLPLAAGWAGAILLFTLSRAGLLSALLMAVVGFCQIGFVAAAGSRIQAAAPDRGRGRVMTLHAQALTVAGPIGNLQAGVLAALLGAPGAMLAGAALAAVSVVGARIIRPAAFGGRRPASVPTGTAVQPETRAR